MEAVASLSSKLYAAAQAAPLFTWFGLATVICAAAFSPSQQPLARWSLTPALLLSPIILIGSAPAVWILLSASVLLFGAIAEFARRREGYQPVAPAALRLMFGAALAPPIWAAVPAIAVISPALSPWRASYHQLFGFLLVLWAPTLMLVGATLYLLWMFDLSVYNLSGPALELFRLKFPTVATLVAAPPLIIIALRIALEPTSLRAGVVGLLAAAMGLASMAATGAPVFAQLALTSGAAFAFAAGSMRPGILVALTVIGSTASAYAII
jgi:hypothetical protein